MIFLFQFTVYVIRLSRYCCVKDYVIKIIELTSVTFKLLFYFSRLKEILNENNTPSFKHLRQLDAKTNFHGLKV